MNVNYIKNERKMKSNLLNDSGFNKETADQTQIFQNLSIRLLTYNIFLRPPPVKNNFDDYKNERCNEFLKTINDYDIICLQEIFGFLNKRKHKIVKKAFKNGFHYFASSHSPSFFSTFLVDGGLLTLSRYEILVSKFVPYKYCVLTDSLSQKGVLYSKILIKDHILHLFNTHTQASYVGKESDLKATIITRIDQFIELRNFIDKTLIEENYKESDLVIIAGDLNVDYRNCVYSFQNFNHPLREHFGPYHEYDEIIKILTKNKNKNNIVIDLLCQNFKERPVTYGDIILDEKNEKTPKETALTNPEDLLSEQSLDYILQYIPRELNEKILNEKEDNTMKLSVDVSSFKIEKFMVTGNFPFTQLSDHYGVMGSLIYKGETSKGEESITLDSEI